LLFSGVFFPEGVGRIPLFLWLERGTMPKIIEGETYTGDELVELLGGESKAEDYKAIGNDKVRLILADEGNDNYTVLHIIKLN